MSTMVVDAQFAEVSNSVGGSSLPRRHASGGVYTSNPAVPLVVPVVFPVGVGTSITAIAVHLRGAGTQTITVTPKLHDIAADTIANIGTPGTVAAAGAYAVASGLPFTPTATQALEIEILGLDANLRFTGAVITYT